MLHRTGSMLEHRIVNGRFVGEIQPFLVKLLVGEPTTFAPMGALPAVEVGGIVNSFAVTEFAAHLFVGTVLDMPDFEAVDGPAGDSVHTVVSHVDVRVGNGAKHDFRVRLRVDSPPTVGPVRVWFGWLGGAGQIIPTLDADHTDFVGKTV